MDLLVLNPMILARISDKEWDFRDTNACKFKVSINGGPLVDVDQLPLVGTNSISLPPTPRPLPLTIRAEPTSPRFFPVQADFEYLESGNLVAKITTDDSNPDIEDQAFRPPTSVQFPTLLQTPFGNVGGGTIVTLQVFLSRIRDVTRKAFDVINQVPKKFKDDGWIPVDNWLAQWPSQPKPNLRFIRENLLDSAGGLDFELADNTVPDSVDRVFEVANVTAPQLLAMWWPSTLPTTAFAEPTQFFVYLHPHLGQAAAEYAPFPYPFSFPYLFFIARRDANYGADPLTEFPGPKGLNYQRAHSGKNVALIGPVPTVRSNPEMGVFTDPEEMEGLLREIQAFMFRRNRVYKPPGLGRVAVGAFSNGAGLHMLPLLQKDRSHPFLRDFLKELYLFDPRMNSAVLANEALQWAQTDPANKKIRVYLTIPDAAYAKIIAANFTLPSLPFAKNSDDGARTLAVTRIIDWVNAAKANGATPKLQQIINAFGPVHELQPGTMATHALKLSGFSSA